MNMFKLLLAVMFCVAAMAVRAAGEVKPFQWTAAASGDTLELTATVAPGHSLSANET